MINKQTVIQLAISQIGYHEKASNMGLDDPIANSGSNNWTKYARDLDAIEGFYNGKKNGYAWCDMFVDWCFVKAYGVAMGMKLLCQPWQSTGAGCAYSAQFYEQRGQFFGYPETGDQIFFDYGSGINHTGIVIDVNDYAIVTVEGNSNEMVQKNSYPHNSSIIAGYGRPDWNMDGEPDVPDIPEPDVPTTDTCEVTVTLPIIRYGDVSMYVKIMQVLLIGKGFSCGRYGADGEYGTDTKIGLFQFQKANDIISLETICDQETWQKLLS